jgi:hypothetical protein
MMKRLFLVLTLALGLSGCAGLGGVLDSTGLSIFKGGTSITASITNPATPTNIYQVKSVYATALDLANAYRDYCYARPYKTLMADSVAGPICKNRRSIVTKLQSADDVASTAIAKADAFIKANPTLSATGLISQAYAAVVNFQGAINTTAASVAPVQQ